MGRGDAGPFFYRRVCGATLASAIGAARRLRGFTSGCGWTSEPRSRTIEQTAWSAFTAVGSSKGPLPLCVYVSKFNQPSSIGYRLSFIAHTKVPSLEIICEADEHKLKIVFGILPAKDTK